MTQIQQTICLPSQGSQGKFDRHFDRTDDRYVVLPVGADTQAAIQAINEITHAVNLEHSENGGECLDGLSIEENIERRITEFGFVFLQQLETAKPWDSYDVMEEFHRNYPTQDRG